MLKIIDLKVGNIGSVIKALRHIGVKFEIITEPSGLNGATKIIFPGVGSFDTAADRLTKSGFRDALTEFVWKQKIPFLGICVGMQLLAKEGFEGVHSTGLGFIDGVVNRLDDLNESVLVPHMGWNNIENLSGSIFQGIEQSDCFYFVHSYAMKLNDNNGLEVCYTDHGESIVAFIRKEHIYGAQFHPEKSQKPGLTFLRNFIEKC